MDNMSKIEFAVSQYYTNKILEFGETPKGVDWNTADQQTLRYELLLQIVRDAEPTVIADIGSGYGFLVELLEARGIPYTYLGYDISKEMIDRANARYQNVPHVTFKVGKSPEAPVDYAVASGIFNVRMNFSDEEWLQYIFGVLDEMHAKSKRGFSFNCLTAYSDPPKMRKDLYYADPLALFDHCMRNYSRFVTLLHDYPLYEFTVLVRKQ